MDAKDQKRQLPMGRGVVRDAKIEAQALLDAVAKDTGLTLEHTLWDRFLNCVDWRIQFEAFRLLKSYASGKPTEKQEVEVTGSYLAEVPLKLSNDEWAKRFSAKPAEKDGQA